MKTSMISHSRYSMQCARGTVAHCHSTHPEAFTLLKSNDHTVALIKAFTLLQTYSSTHPSSVTLIRQVLTVLEYSVYPSRLSQGRGIQLHNSPRLGARAVQIGCELNHRKDLCRILERVHRILDGEFQRGCIEIWMGYIEY